MMIKNNPDMVKELSLRLKTQGNNIARSAVNITYDTYTTTHPNIEMKEAYIDLQEICKDFEVILNRDAKWLAEVNDDFEELDQAMSNTLKG